MKKIIIISLSLLFSLSVSGQKNGYSSWNTDTIHGFEGRYYVSKSRMKNLKSSSVNKIQRITEYYNTCGEIESQTKSLLVGSVLPRPKKFRSKEFKSHCQNDSSDFNSITIVNDSLSVSVKECLISTTSLYNDSLRFIIKNLYGQELIIGDFTIDKSSYLIESNMFPWTGRFVIEIYLGSRLIMRDELEIYNS